MEEKEKNCGVMDRTVLECAPPVINSSGIPRCGICGAEVPVATEEEMESYLQSYTRDQERRPNDF